MAILRNSCGLWAAALVGFAAAPATAQEDCAATHVIEQFPGGAVFRQNLSCGDGNSRTILTCRRGAETALATLPLAPSGAAAGAKDEVRFTVDGKTFAKTLTVTRPATSGDFGGSRAVLARDDPLWLALTTPGTAIATEADGGLGEVSILATGTARLAVFKKACGLP